MHIREQSWEPGAGSLPCFLVVMEDPPRGLVWLGRSWEVVHHEHDEHREYGEHDECEEYEERANPQLSEAVSKHHLIP